MHYAQLSNGVVTAITETSGQIDSSDMVQIDFFDASLIGRAYVNGEFVAPTPRAEPRHITVGAFFDRFSGHKWPILADTNPVVQAFIKDCSVRKHIDLDDHQLPAGLGLLVEAGHAIDHAAVLGAPVLPNELP